MQGLETVKTLHNFFNKGDNMKVVVKDGKVGKGLMFQRLRRVTGYLSGDYKTRFNDGKIAEVNARVKHC